MPAPITVRSERAQPPGDRNEAPAIEIELDGTDTLTPEPDASTDHAPTPHTDTPTTEPGASTDHAPTPHTDTPATDPDAPTTLELGNGEVRGEVIFTIPALDDTTIEPDHTDVVDPAPALDDTTIEPDPVLSVDTSDATASDPAPAFVLPDPDDLTFEPDQDVSPAGELPTPALDVPAAASSSAVVEQPVVEQPVVVSTDAESGDGHDARRQWILVVIALVGIVAAALLFFAWTSAGDERDEAVAERDAAIAERDAANGAREQATDELAAAQSALEEARAELDRVGTSGTPGTPGEPVDLADLADDVALLQTANAELAEQIAEFRAELALAPGAPAGTAVFVAAEHPEFSQYVGEQLSSWSGPTPLTAQQNRCFGGTVVEAIGLEAVGAGLSTDATPEAFLALTSAMQQAAFTCGFDQSLIFP